MLTLNPPGGAGKEVVVRYGSSLRSGRPFATDANGREMQVLSTLLALFSLDVISCSTQPPTVRSGL